MAQTLAEGAVYFLECSLGRYSCSQLSEWRLPAGFDVEGAARRVAEEPDVWTDGSPVDDKVSGVSSAGAGVHCFGVFGICLQDFGDVFLVILVLITVGYGILGGKSAVMVLLPGPKRLRLKTFFKQAFSLVWLSEWVCCFFIGWGFAPSLLFCQVCL